MFLQRQSSEEKNQTRELRKPKIVNEILKPGPPNNFSKQKYNKQHTTVNSLVDAKIKRDERKHIEQVTKLMEKEKLKDKFDISEQDNTFKKTFSSDKINKIGDKIVHEDQNVFERKSKFKNELLTLYNEFDSRNQKEVNNGGEYDIEIRKLTVEDRVRNMQTRDVMRRSKSLADVQEIGNALKGNVNQILYKIKSRDHLNFEEKREVINVKERPRKKSVLEKIALFEVSAN